MSFKLLTLKGGLVTGGLLICYLLLIELFQYFSNTQITESYQIFVLGLGIYYSLAEFKKNNQGLLSFKKALQLGMGASCIGGLFLGIYSWVYVKYFNPKVLEILLKNMQEILIKQNSDKANIDRTMLLLKEMVTPEFLIFSGILSCCIAGIFISITLGLFLKKNISDLSPHRN